MQHRAILRPTKRGTITYAQALRAARAAKKAQSAGGTHLPKVPRVADIYGFGFAPAIGEPKGPASARGPKRAATKRPAKKRGSARATRSS